MATCAVCNTETFKYLVLDGQNVCYRCPHPRAAAHNVFPFVAEHLAGQPVINSLHHLRQVERAQGVDSVAFNMDSARWNQPPQQRTARERIPFLQKGSRDRRGISSGVRQYTGG